MPIQPPSHHRYLVTIICLWALVGITLAGLVYAADPVAIKHQGPDTLGNPLGVAVYPPGVAGTFQTSVANSTQTTTGNLQITASIGGSAGVTSYITGFEVTGAGATAASIVTVTITGTPNTLNYQIVVPAGVTTSITPLLVEFPQALPATTTNTAIVVTVPAFGAGNTNAAVTVHGFRQ